MKFDPNRLILGCTSLGGLYLDGVKPDTDRAVKVIAEAISLGIKHFDTAPLYGWGASEYFLGRALEAAKAPRSEIKIATKALRALFPCIESRDTTQPDFWTLGEPNSRFTHKWRFDYDSTLQTALRSLEIMRMSYIDELSLHDIGDALEEDTSLTWEKLDEAIRGCRDLKKAGFIREVGFGSKESATLKILAKRHPGLISYATTTTYNILDQQFLTEGSFEFCKEHGIEYRIAGPFCSRLLAVDPRKAVRRPGKDGTTRWYYNNNVDQPVTFNYRYITEADYARACRLWNLAQEHGEATPRAVAIQFVLSHPQISKIAIGASEPSHLESIKREIEQPIKPTLWDALKKEGIINSEAPCPV